MEDQFFSAFTDEMTQIKTAALVGEGPKAMGLLQAGGKSVGQFFRNIRKGWRGEPTTALSEEVGKGLGGAYQKAKAGIQAAWKDPTARRGVKAALGGTGVAVGIGGAGYLHGRLRGGPTVNIQRGY